MYEKIIYRRHICKKPSSKWLLHIINAYEKREDSALHNVESLMYKCIIS